MSTQELKTSILKIVKGLEDPMALEDIHDRVSQWREGIVPELGCTLDEYNKELEEGDAVIQRGEYYTQEEVFDFIDKELAALEKEKQKGNEAQVE